jgi:NAD(P)-dependent dehydrogenase (short-subunit alcohol dehydrogenase family)
MVNNAGVAVEAQNPQPIHTTTEQTWDLTMRVNAKSVFLGCKYAITQMLEQEPHESGDRGWIINISSIYGLVGGLDNRKLRVVFLIEMHLN